MSATALRIVLQPGRAETLHACRLFTVADVASSPRPPIMGLYKPGPTRPGPTERPRSSGRMRDWPVAQEKGPSASTGRDRCPLHKQCVCYRSVEIQVLCDRPTGSQFQLLLYLKQTPPPRFCALLTSCNRDVTGQQPHQPSVCRTVV